MPSSHLILCRPLLLLPPIPPSIRVFSNESTLCMRWPKYWSFSLSIIPSKEIPGLISFRWPGWISLQSKGLSRVFSNTSNLDYKNQSHNLVTILQKKNKKPSYFPTDHRWSNFGLFKIYPKKLKNHSQHEIYKPKYCHYWRDAKSQMQTLKAIQREISQNVSSNGNTVYKNIRLSKVTMAKR